MLNIDLRSHTTILENLSVHKGQYLIRPLNTSIKGCEAEQIAVVKKLSQLTDLPIGLATMLILAILSSMRLFLSTQLFLFSSFLAHRTIVIKSSVNFTLHLRQDTFWRYNSAVWDDFCDLLSLEWLLFYSRRFHIHFRLYRHCSSRHESFYSILFQTRKTRIP